MDHKPQRYQRCVSLNHFKHLFIPSQDRNTISPSDTILQNLPKLSPSHKDILNKPFSDKEIQITTFAASPLKSPGPNGIPLIFFQESWENTKDNVCSSFHEFTKSDFLLKERNKTFICLIPKSKNPTDANNFRPISLCNTSYKIIFKTLTSRLRLILGDIVGQFQNAFFPR